MIFLLLDNDIFYILIYIILLYFYLNIDAMSFITKFRQHLWWCSLFASRKKSKRSKQRILIV